MTSIRNIEIKLRLEDPAGVRQRVTALADGPGQRLNQHDTYFTVPEGYLKLRRENGRASLIGYRRPRAAEARQSGINLAPLADADATAAVLARCLPVRAEIIKRRDLYFRGQTRIHLDRVEDLGEFLEFEVVLKPGQSDDDGIAIVRDLMARLGLDSARVESGSYLDLLTGDRQSV